MKKLTVLDFCLQIGIASDKIPVVVKSGTEKIACYHSLYRIPATASPVVLEAKINFVTITRTEIIIQVKQAK